ncbi:thiamine pyrophosphate-binding protein [Variovorax paradoxus]|nr:thiamine pyrophosphate-binding protein [Variovorax paradoxus]MBT2302508.1 thiamine pyrophosphate-binding protein [Variovorax paradoxus]
MAADRIPTHEALALQIKRLGAEYVFGLMSEETAQLIASIDSCGVRFCSARHENNAVAMAEGYASASGRLGIALIGRGPATANGLHGLVYARKTGSRVLVLLGAGTDAPPNPNGFGPDTKALDASAVLQGAGVRHMVAHDPESAPQMLAQAAAAASHGLMALLLPMNVLNGMAPASAGCEAIVLTAPSRQAAPREAAISAATALLQRARKPLIVSGVGAHRAGAAEAIARLADHIGAALCTTMKAKDMFRGHPFDCGVLGSFSHSAGRRLIEQADCILVFGAGLNQRTTSQGTSLPAGTPLIQVDISREAIGRWLHCDVAVAGDARAVAEALMAAVPPRQEEDKMLRSDGNRRILAEYRPELDFEARHTPRTIDPRTVGVELDRMLPADRNVVYDAGNFLSVAAYVSVPGPAHIKQASDFSSIGMGFGTALGFACGDRHRVTVLFIGDGAFLMTMSELETAAREGIPLVIVLMNDCAYGAELHFLKLRDMPLATTQFPDIDYAPVAEAFGFRAATVRTVEELRRLGGLLAAPDGPVFIDCKINGAVAAAFLEETAPKRSKT